MRKSFAALPLILVFLTAFSVTITKPGEAESSNPWTPKSSMPTPRYDLGVVAVNGKIYAIGGRTGKVYQGEYAPLRTNEMYDPVSNTWTTKALMPTARFYFGIAVVMNKIYVFGGQRGYNMSDAGGPILCPSTEVYDPAMDTWETKTPMPTPRTQLRANAVNDLIYLIGGTIYKSGYSSYSSKLNEVYDPATDTWTTKAPTPTSEVNGYGSAVVDNKIFIVGGSSGLTQIYNPAFDSWSEGAAIPVKDRQVAAATTGVRAEKKIYVLGGGWIFGSSLNQIYDIENDSWSNGSPMPTGRNGLGLAVVDDVLYAMGGGFGGTNYDGTGANEQYVPWNEKPVAPPSLPPTVSLLSPANTTYSAEIEPYVSVPLIFESNASLSWVGYSLDGGSNVTVANGTVIEIPAESRSLTLCANDTAGSWAMPQTVYYEIRFNPGPVPPPPEDSLPFPTVLVVVFSVIVAVSVGAGLLLYRRKHRTEAART